MIKLLLLLCLALSIICSKVSTKQFFEQKLGYSLNYETYSGYQQIGWYYPSGTTGMYYSFFQGIGKNLSDKNVPLIIWLEGGPGYSSQWSAFNMIGPLEIDGETVYENGWAWSIQGHVVFVDQPLGVGFSYNKNSQVNNTYDASHHFINFLSRFYEEWGLKENPLYITGTSYAGHYIPVIARNIISNMSLNFNLKGVLIGGAWVDPVTQANYVDSFLHSVGILSQAGRTTTASMQNEALARILNGKYAEAGEYINWIEDEEIQTKFFGNVDLENYKNYNLTDSNYSAFLQANKQKFGVPDEVSYKEFNRDIFRAFVASGDYAKSTGDEVDFILNRGLRVLLYNGQNDVEVPTASTLAFLNTIEWRELSQWQRTSKQPWSYVGKKVGWFKKYSNLIFAFVKNGGHSTPYDQPYVCLSMLSNFIHNIW